MKMRDLRLTEEDFLIDGRRQPLLMGEIHYFRMPVESWETALDKLQACGANGVAYYVPWLVHEPEEGQFDFSGERHPQNNLRAWIRMTQEKGLIGFVRPGPYVYAETADLGIPRWFLEKYPRARVQRYADGRYENAGAVNFVGHNHPDFLAAVERWYAAVAKEIRGHLSPGGNICLVQLCNEIPGDDHDDRNPETLGIGRPDGMFPLFLQSRYETVEALNGRYDTRFRSFSEAEPHLLEAAAPELYQSERRIFDYTSYYPAYFRRLRKMFTDHGVETQFVHNAYNPGAVSLHVSNREQNPWLSVGVDCYYSLHGRLGLREATYYCEYGAEYIKRFLHCVPWVVEQECGYWQDDPVVYGPEVHIFNVWTMASGYKGMNLYLFASGHNRPGMGFYGTDHNWQAPMDVHGQERDSYRYVRQSLRDILRDKDVLLSENRTDIALGIKSDPGLNWTRIAKPSAEAYYTLKSAGFSPRLVDFEKEDLGSFPALFVVSDETMEEAAQEKLIAYVRDGGKLILSGRVPTRNHWNEPCVVIADRLGIQAGFSLIEDRPQEKLIFLETEYPIGTAVQPLVCGDAATLAKTQGGLPAVVSLALGTGEALLLPFTMNNLFFSVAELTAAFLAQIGIHPYIKGARRLRVIPKASGHAVALNLHPIAVTERVTIGREPHQVTLTPYSYRILKAGRCG